ncbi:UNVERIFIED_CONTAM: hypothetical protein PYX00_003461 [Menopon gallinae]|uniref:Uncharacterized protein n=1 Tax=Menopon gallinae TaxID=328185 RepID=A0AAW2I1T1_9NEOP
MDRSGQVIIHPGDEDYRKHRTVPIHGAECRDASSLGVDCRGSDRLLDQFRRLLRRAEGIQMPAEELRDHITTNSSRGNHCRGFGPRLPGPGGDEDEGDIQGVDQGLLHDERER